MHLEPMIFNLKGVIIGFLTVPKPIYVHFLTSSEGRYNIKYEEHTICIR